MRNCKRLIPLFLIIVGIGMLFPMSAFAADDAVRLTISYENSDSPLVGARFDIYLVAELKEDGQLTAVQEFDSFKENIKNDSTWQTLASTLEGYVQRDSIPAADSGQTGADGTVTFPTSEDKNLTPGLYLVLGQRHEQDSRRYDPTPFMVVLSGEASVGQVTASAKYNFSKVPDDGGGGSDSSTISRKVLKVWKDDGHEKKRPEEVVVQLLRDGKIYDTVTLNADNYWRHTWTELSDKYTWTLTETELDDYTMEITREGITFVVTNTYAEEIPDEPSPTSPGTPSEDIPDEPLPGSPAEPGEPGWPTGTSLPQTGQLWWPVPILMTAGLLLIVIGLIRRKGAADEA